MIKNGMFSSVLLAVILGLLAFSLLQKSNSDTCQDWEIIFKNDKQGNTVHGSRAQLIQAIRNGCDVKIAWGSQRNERSIEHVSEPIWLAIQNESEVVAYLDAQVFLPKDKTDWQPQEWRVKITTGGAFDAVWLNRITDTLVRNVPQQHTMAWMVRCSNAGEKATPLFSNQ
ncbi:MAG: hypothetical protein AAGJ18_05530 [Bacteroidota bacterium]